MIFWMSAETGHLLDEAHVAVYGFDPDRDSASAVCWLETADRSFPLTLGDVRGLSDAEIDARFRSALAALAASGADDLSLLGADCGPLLAAAA